MFWLLAATDGHAKNFSLHLSPGGRFRSTPLYDVLSAQPYADAGQIRRGALKLAMSAGDGRHYRIDEVMPRHFVETAARGGMSEDAVEAVFADIVATAPSVLDGVVASMPPDVPADLIASIAAGFTRRLDRLAGR